MTAVEIYDKLNAIKKAGVILIPTKMNIKEPQISISLSPEKGGRVVYNADICPVSIWLGRVYDNMKAVGLIN